MRNSSFLRNLCHRELCACKDLKGGGAAAENLGKTRLKNGASLAVGGQHYFNGLFPTPDLRVLGFAPRLNSLPTEGLLICVRLRRNRKLWPITQHHK